MNTASPAQAPSPGPKPDQGPDRGPLNDDARIVVAGAGAIGQYVGIRLAAQGRNVAFLGRKSLVDAAARTGLTATDIDGGQAHLAPGTADVHDDPSVLANADVVLVAVKSRDTDAMAAAIAAHAPGSAVIVSLQNGLRNVERLRAALPGWDVRAGMVPFNIAVAAPGVVRRGSKGDLRIASGAPSGARSGTAHLLTVDGLTTHEHDDLTGVMWSKLLLNLNNALDALAGLTVHAQLSNPAWRRLFAACVDEGIAEAKAAGVKLARIEGSSPKVLPMILRLPTWAFHAIMAMTVKFDRNARSSMQNDLARFQLTEIDDLQGEISRRAHARGAATPYCTAIAILVREAEAASEGSPKLTPARVEDMVRRGRV